MAAENVSVGRELGTRPALRCFSQGWPSGTAEEVTAFGVGVGGPLLPYTSLCPASEPQSALSCPSGLDSSGPGSDRIIDHSREVIIYPPIDCTSREFANPGPRPRQARDNRISGAGLRHEHFNSSGVPSALR